MFQIYELKAEVASTYESVRAAAERHTFSYDKLASMFSTPHEERGVQSDTEVAISPYPGAQVNVAEDREETETESDDERETESAALEVLKVFAFSLLDALLNLAM